MGQEASGENGAQEVPSQYEKEPCTECDRALEQPAQRVCGIFFLGGIQTPLGHDGTVFSSACATVTHGDTEHVSDACYQPHL